MVNNKMHILNGWEPVRLGEDAWSVRSIQDICLRVTSGGTPSRRQPSFYEDGCWPWLKTQELQDGWLDDSEEHITDDAVASSSAKVLPENTVLMAMYGATVGRLGILRRPMTCNQACCAMIVDPGRADYRYLFYQLLHARPRIRNLATGAAQQNLSGQLIKSLQFPCPPLPEQRAIAAVLGSIDETLERTEEVIAAKEQLRNSLLHELLTHGVPDWHTEWKEVAGLGTIPAAWQIVRLGDVVKINHSNWDPTDGSSILYLDLTAVVAPGILAKSKKIAAADAPSRARRRVHDGDILVSTVRPNLRGFARIVNAPDNLIASTGFAVLTPLSTVNHSFVYYHVMADPFAIYLNNATTGQAYPAVRPTDIANYRIPLPSLEEQRTITAVLDGIDETLARTRSERDRLQFLKEAIADVLLTGRVQVSISRFGTEN